MPKHIGRRTTAAAALMIAALTLSACGPDTSGVAAEAQDLDFEGVEPADEITFWTNHPGGSADVENELIAQFEAETGITVNVVTSGANYEETSQRFQTAQGTGDIGDVVVLSDATWFPNYLNGSLIPVDEVLDAAGVDTSTYVAALFEDYLYDGAHYGAPYARSTPLFYYNADHYAEAGLDAPPQTWEEVAEHSRALVDSGVTDAAFAFPSADSYVSWTMANNVWGWGGAWSDGTDFSPIASPETVAALEFAQDAVGDWAVVSSTSPDDDFGAGSVSQVIASTGSLAGILDVADFEVGTAFLPGGPVDQGNVVPTGGAGLMIASDSTPERQLAAALFIGHITSAESTALFSASTGYVPVRTDADMSSVYAGTPQFETAVEQLSRARVQDFARVFLPGGDRALSETLQRILTTDADAATELGALEEQFASLYERDLASLLDD